MKVLVLGAAGQIGRALVAAAPPGAAVTALDRRGCDIADAGAVARCIAAARPDLVFNAAAYTAVDQAEDDEAAAQCINGAAPGWIASACREGAARLVHLSTDYVFDGRAHRPYRPEDDALPVSAYGRTKWAGEQAVRAAAPEALIVRTAWVYAPDGRNFLATMLRLLAEREMVRVVDDQIGTPTSAATLAASLWALALQGATGMLHVTDAGVASWYDFAVAIREEALAADLLAKAAPVVPIGTADFSTRAPRPAFAVLEKHETWRLLGAPAAHWRDALRTCIGGMAGG